MQSQPVADSCHVRILIVDAQQSSRDILRGQLEREPQIGVVGQADNSYSASALARHL